MRTAGSIGAGAIAVPALDFTATAQDNRHTKEARGMASRLRRAGIGDPEDLIRRVVELRGLRRSVRETFPDGKHWKRHADALAGLEDRVLRRFLFLQEKASGRAQVTVAVVGDFSSGKSTFINALLGEELCPVDVDPTTSSVTWFSQGSEVRFEREDEDGKRELIDREIYQDTVRHSPTRQSAPHVFHVAAALPQLEGLRLIDTPGFNNPKNESVDTAATQRAASDADALFVVMDIRKGNVSGKLLERLEELRAGAKDGDYETPAFLLINQADRQGSRTAQKKVKDKNEKKHGALFREVMLLSSKQLNEGMDQGVVDAINAHVERVKEAILKRQGFDTQLVGRLAAEGAAAFEVDVDGNRYKLSVAPDDLLVTRAELTELLDALRSQRYELLERKEERDRKALRKDWRSTLSALLKYLRNSRISSTPDQGDQAEAEFRGLHDSAKFEVGQRIRELHQECMGLCLKDDNWTESTFWGPKEHYQIYSTPWIGCERARGHDIWNQISEEIDDYLRRLNTRFDLNLTIDHADAYRNTIQQSLDSQCGFFAKEVGLGPSEPHILLADWDDVSSAQQDWDARQARQAEIAELMSSACMEQVISPLFEWSQGQFHAAHGRQEAAAQQQKTDLTGLITDAKSLLEDLP